PADRRARGQDPRDHAAKRTPHRGSGREPARNARRRRSGARAALRHPGARQPAALDAGAHAEGGRDRGRREKHTHRRLGFARRPPRDPGAERRRLGDDHPRRIPVRVLGRTALLAWLAIVAASAWWTARHTAFTSDLTAFLPAASGRLERLLEIGRASCRERVAVERG